jgi:hypothetical protein
VIEVGTVLPEPVNAEFFGEVRSVLLHSSKTLFFRQQGSFGQKRAEPLTKKSAGLVATERASAGGNDGLAVLSGAERNGTALRTGRARRAAVLRLDFWLLFIKEK